MPMEEEKLMEDEAKKKKRETMKWGAKISAPTHLNSAKVELTQSN